MNRFSPYCVVLGPIFLFSLLFAGVGGCPAELSSDASGSGEVVAGSAGDGSPGNADDGSGGTTDEGSSGTGGDVDPGGDPGGANSDPNESPQASADALRIVELVNAERAAHSLAPLTLNSLLSAAAQSHAEDMFQNGFFSHTGSNGSSVSDRVTAAGYAWSTVGENIAYGAASPEQVMQMWMNSSGHRANILGAGYTEIGVGIEPAGALWVQVFGRPQ